MVLNSSQNIIITLILLSIGFEYIKLAENITIYRVITLPLSLFLFLSLKANFKKINSKFSLVVISFVFLNIFYFFINQELTGIFSLLSMLPFVLVSFKIFSIFSHKKVFKIFVFYSLFNLISYFLFLYYGITFSETDQERFSGFHFDANQFCIYVIISLISKYYLIVNTNQKKQKLIFFVLILFDLLLILLSLSRSSIIVLVTLSLVYLFLTRKNKILSFILTLSTIAFFYLKSYSLLLPKYLNLVENSFDKFVFRFFIEQSSSSNRLQIIEDYINSFSNNNLFIGEGYYSSIVSIGKYSHNSILDFSLNIGLFFTSLYVLILLISIVYCLIKLRRMRDKNLIFLFLISLSIILFSTTLSIAFTKIFFLSLIILSYVSYNCYYYKGSKRRSFKGY